MKLTAPWQRYIRKLEIRCEELERKHSQDMDVYRANSLEIIDLRAKVAYFEAMATEILTGDDNDGN